MKKKQQIMPFTLCLGALLILSGIGCARIEGNEMERNNKLAMDLLDLPDRDFFGLSEELELELMLQLSDTPFRGLAINAPKMIDIAEREQLPVILLSQKTGMRDWEVDFELNTTIIAVDLDRSVVFMVHAFGDKKLRDFTKMDRSMSGPKPDADDAEAISSGVHLLDIREICDLPWERGHYAITVITHDWISNTIMVELRAKEGEIATETEHFFPRERASLLAESIRESGGKPGSLPSFVPSPNSPELGNIGVALSVPEVVSDQVPQIPIYGMVRMPAPKCGIVEPPSPDSSPDADSSEERSDSDVPAVVLTGTLMLAQKDVLERARIDIQTPVYTELAVQPGDIVKGYFGLDLKTQVSELLPGMDYLVYLIIGKYIDGPHRIVISGTEDMEHHSER